MSTALLFLPSIALASAMPFYAQSWFEMVVGGFVTVVLPLMLGILNNRYKGSSWLNIANKAGAYTQAYWGTTIKQINEKAADGSFTEEERKRQKRQAMENLVTSFTKANGGKFLIALKTGVAVSEVPTAVRGLLEGSVSGAKNAAKAARLGN